MMRGGIFPPCVLAVATISEITYSFDFLKLPTCRHLQTTYVSGANKFIRIMKIRKYLHSENFRRALATKMRVTSRGNPTSRGNYFFSDKYPRKPGAFVMTNFFRRAAIACKELTRARFGGLT
jgi:hypothetical protein